MRRWFVIAGLATLGTIVVATQDFDALSDPWANQVTVEKGYHPKGNIALESPRDRRGETHGWEILYDVDGRIISEILFEHGVWQVRRTHDYKTALLKTSDARVIPPMDTDEPIPEEYREYRSTERRPERLVAE